MRLLALLMCYLVWALPGEQARWEDQGGSPAVRCTTEQGGPWCRSEAVLGVGLGTVDRTLGDFAGYTRYFPRVQQIGVLAPGVVLARVALPSPFANRLWLVRFTRSASSQGVRYAWGPTQHADAVLEGGVLLERYAGEWVLTPVDAGHTRVQVTFHADLGGDVPGWVSAMGWKTQGEEMLKQLASAVGAPL